MNRFLPLAIAVVLASSGAGCAGRELDREAIARRLTCRTLPLARGIEAPAEPRRPIRIAVHFESYHRSMANNRYEAWSDGEKARILGALREWGAEGIVATAEPIEDARLTAKPGEADPRVLAEAAARSGAEAILVIHGGGDLEERSNPFAAFYIVPLLGCMVSPGTTIDAVFAVRGTLLDAGASKAVAVAEGEAERGAMGPLLFVSGRRVAERAKEAAIGAFLAELEGKLAALPAR